MHAPMINSLKSQNYECNKIEKKEQHSFWNLHENENIST